MVARPSRDIVKLIENVCWEVSTNVNPVDRAQNLQLAQINLLCGIAQSLQEIYRATHHLAVISGQGYE